MNQALVSLNSIPMKTYLDLTLGKAVPGPKPHLASFFKLIYLL